MNKVILIGNLARDPELSTTPNGISYCRMTVAVQRRFANQNGEREADFLNVTCWRATADNCQKFLKKGSKVGVVGSIQTRSYEQDGVKKYITDIVADEVEFLSSRNAADNSFDDFDGGKKGKGSIRDLEPIEDDSLPF